MIMFNQIEAKIPPSPYLMEDCPRCHQRHIMSFDRLQNPIISGDIIWTYWGACFTTGEPILMRPWTDDPNAPLAWIGVNA